ncbi:MAG: hypothetical protein QGD92_10255 [Gammaproteobacteria bacterium]|nr:hypothetical protein [Gammaproteobacteria bacterium]
MHIRLPVFLMSSLLCSSVVADPCEYERFESVRRDLASIASIELNALAGELYIQSHSADELAIRGRICADSEKYLKDIRLEVELSDQRLVVTVIMPPSNTFWDPDYAYMDLEVELPAEMPIHIKDSSGDIILRGISAASINDGSGKIKGVDLKSSTRIEDSSGDIVIRGLDGSISVTDSSGDVDLANVTGDVDIIADGSGEIEISRTGGYVKIGRDGSGGIDIDYTGGDVTIDSDGSGNIQISHVEGHVHIGTDGSGSIDISDVTGDFRVDAKGSGDIRTKRIQGNIFTPR